MPCNLNTTKLYRSYMGDARREHPRHRGNSPHQIAYFTRSLRREETAFLASVLSLLDALPAGPLRGDSDALSTRGELLCQGFEAYRQLSLRPR
jgi:hypothetical protein